MKILLLGRMYHQAGEEYLKGFCEPEIIDEKDIKQEDLASKVKDVDAIIVRYPIPVQGDLIKDAKNLKCITTSGRGTDLIDKEVAQANDIKVINTTAISAKSVAEHTMALILSLAKRIPTYDYAIRNGDYSIRDTLPSFSLEEKTIGIVGFGNIGREVAHKSSAAFNMQVKVYDPFLDEKSFDKLNYEFTGLASVLQHSDILSIHPDLNDTSKGMIGLQEIEKMKEQAFLINTSRGKVLKEDELAIALKRKLIAGAALDVFEEEPTDVKNALFNLENVIVTPHVGALTYETCRDLAILAAKNTIEYLKSNGG